MLGRTDADLMRQSVADNRVIVTHDPDFGTLAILGGEPVVGIVFLRPGHINSQFTIQTLQTLLLADPDLVVPFLIVAKRSGTAVSIRVRSLGP